MVELQRAAKRYGEAWRVSAWLLTGTVCACSVDARVFHAPEAATLSDTAASASNADSPTIRANIDTGVEVRGRSGPDVPDDVPDVPDGLEPPSDGLEPASAGSGPIAGAGALPNYCNRDHERDAGTGIVLGPGIGGWLLSDAPCTSHADCIKTLFTPVCDLPTGRCTICPDPAQQATLSTAVGICIGFSRERCCREMDADIDCVFRDCITSCERK
jgi:hypothetical protein